MSITRSTIAALMLMASGGLAMAQTATPAPAMPAATPTAPTAVAPAPALSDATKDNPAWVKFRSACKADIAKHCGEVERVKGERGKLRACLETNKASLSSDCTAAIVERDAAAKAKKS